MLTPEFISKVIGFEVKSFKFNQTQPTLLMLNLTFWTNDENEKICSGCQKSINYFEFAYKCKDFAMENGFFIDVRMLPDKTGEATLSNDDCSITKVFDAKMEPDAVCDACQWMIENCLPKV